jgi:uncharacterized repeat protein (TIGR01451 family)
VVGAVAAVPVRSRRHLQRWVSLAATLALVALSVVALGTARSSAAGPDCSFADNGSGAYSRSICWFDLSSYRPAAAGSAQGQAMSLALPDGSTMSFVLNVFGGAVRTSGFPTDPKGFLGNNGHYTGVDGQPALVQRTAGTTSTTTLSNIAVVDSMGKPVSDFAVLGADAGSTDSGEAMVWSSDQPLSQMSPTGAGGLGNACNAGLTGVGTTNVICSANKTTTKTGTAMLAAQSPSTFTQQMVGGTEAIALGVLVARVQLSATLVNPYPGDAVRLDVTSSAGRPVDTATTGSNGTASTGRSVVLAGLDPVQVTLSQTAVSGSLGAYQDSWSCTRGGAVDPSLPSGDAGGSVVVTLSLGSLVSCAITDTAIPASLSLSSTASAPVDVNADGLTDAGDTIGYSFTVTNTGQTTVDSIVVNDRAAGPVTCLATTLAAGDSTTCTTDAPYVVTAADVSAGVVHNVATASGDPAGSPATVTSPPATADTPTTAPAPALTLTTSSTISDVNGDFQIDLGDTVAWSFRVTNSGNVPLTGVGVADPVAGSVTCALSTLPPGGQTTCTADAPHTITQDDVDAGSIVNTATGQGTDPYGNLVRSSTSQTTTPVQHRVTVTGALRAVVTDVNGDGRPDAGDTIQYSMSVHNAGTVTLHAPSVSSSSAAVRFTCPSGPIAPGSDAACLATAVYVVTAADVAAGHVDLTATSHALDPSGATVTGPASTLSTVTG